METYQAKLKSINNDPSLSIIQKKTAIKSLKLVFANEVKEVEQLEREKALELQKKVQKEKIDQGKLKETLEKKKKSATSSLALLADYDDDTSDSTGSRDSAGSQSKKEKFLKRKAERLAKLGDLGEEPSKDRVRVGTKKKTV